MSPTVSTCTLGTVLSQLGPMVTLIGNGETQLDRRVSVATIWLPGDPLPHDTDVLLVCPMVDLTAPDHGIEPLLHDATPRMLAIRAPTGENASKTLAGHSKHHAILVLEQSMNPASVISAVARATQTAEESVSRRLAALQRTFSQALADRSPVESLITKLKKVANATVTLLDRHGDAIHATGPLPLSLLYVEIQKTDAESQILDIDGWHGVATRIVNTDAADEHIGWLMAATRRPTFPDPYALSAVHIAAALIESSQRMTLVVRTQERAIQAAVLEQALALRLPRHDPEIGGRMAGLGISFDEELRAVAVYPARSVPRASDEDVAETLATSLLTAFKTKGVAVLVSVRGQSVALVAQLSAPGLRHLFLTWASELGPTSIGIGRRIETVADVSDSYNDAQLAVRALRRENAGPGLMTYEDFDFATGLFSDLGLDKMASRAEVYLHPLQGREALLEGLQAYFDHGQNIIAAAAELNIHHNSLRYRLSKVEELLEINLKEPGAIASTFLALTALDLSGKLRARVSRMNGGSEPGGANLYDVDAPTSATDFTVGHESHGVVRGDA